jgi:branched-chain amino acid transport system permease protein
MKRRLDPLLLLAALLLLLPAAALLAGQAYYITFATRVLVFAIAALSLNLVLGFGGMTSLGHAAFMGIGAYTVGLLIQNGITNGWMHFAAAIFAGAVLALVVGAVCLRTSGLSAIMLTLAFAQLLFFVASGLKQFGGDDGFSFRGHSDFGPWLQLDKPLAMYLFVLACLTLSAWMVRRVVQSRFGTALRAIKSNEARAASVGLPAYRYKLVAFVLAGSLCSVSGALLANLTQFVSPAYMHWSRSAELLLMVVLGGMGGVVGPVVGAAALLVMEETLAAWTPHWQAAMGLLLVAVVMFARNGLVDARLLWQRMREART